MSKEPGTAPSSWGALAKELGISGGYLSKVRKRDWWDRDLKPENVDEARALLLANLAGYEAKLAAAAETAPPPPGPPQTKAKAKPVNTDALRELLGEDQFDPRAFARETVRFAGRRVVQAAEQGELSAAAFGDMKKAMTELRQAEKDYQEQARKSGELVPRKAAMALGAEIGRALSDSLNSLETLGPSQVLQWLEDPQLARLSERDQTEAVRTWFERRLRDFRELAANQLEELLDRAVEEEDRKKTAGKAGAA